jgi:MAF protein
MMRQAVESFSVTSKTRLILASNSPRRRQLLALSDWEFDVSVADVDESQRQNESPAEYVLRLAETKARAVGTQPDQIILAADTAVVDGSDILGKPKDEAEAFAMLTRLRGHTHQVYTGVGLLRVSDGLLLRELSVTDVPMRDYSDEEIQAYIQTGDPLDKAGAYAIQHASFQPVINLAGCYTSVMGLPLCHVVRLMHKMGFSLRTEVPGQCQTLLEYQCPIFQGVLDGMM